MMSDGMRVLRSNDYRRMPWKPKTWTAEDLRLLRELAEQGVPPALIAARLRKTESAVRNKAMMQGVSLRRGQESAAADVCGEVAPTR